jgi:hypothetical protein
MHRVSRDHDRNTFGIHCLVTRQSDQILATEAADCHKLPQDSLQICCAAKSYFARWHVQSGWRDPACGIRSGVSRSIAPANCTGQSHRSIAKVAPTPGAAHPDLLHALIRFNRGRLVHIGGSAQDCSCGEAEGSRAERKTRSGTATMVTGAAMAGSGPGAAPAATAASHGSAATVATMGARAARREISTALDWTTSGAATASSVKAAAGAARALSIGGAGCSRNADQRRSRCHQYGRIVHVIFLSTWALLDAGIGSLAAPSSASTGQV